VRPGLWIFIAMLIALSTSGCPTTQQRLLDSNVDQLKIRSIQTRAFDTTDRKAVLRATVATLQDLGFVVRQGRFRPRHGDGDEGCGVLGAGHGDGPSQG
jgi:hypothetical protein